MGSCPNNMLKLFSFILLIIGSLAAPNANANAKSNNDKAYVYKEINNQ